MPEISVFKATGQLRRLIENVLIFDMKIINGVERQDRKMTFMSSSFLFLRKEIKTDTETFH